MIRALAPGPLGPPGTAVELEPVERRHLAVRRVASETPIELLDGQGGIGRGRLRADGTVVLDEVIRVPPPVPLSLVVGAGDRDRFGWMVEKAQELGVTAVVPVDTERARNVETRLRSGQLPKLRARVREVLKQCGATWALEIGEPVPLADALEAVAAETRWVADPSGGPFAAGSSAMPAALLIGPEGGLTDPERQAALDRGYLPLWLGPNTLRFETAAIAAAALLVTSRPRRP